MLIKNSGQPLVSVVLPVYNAEKYIAAALSSMLQQTYRGLEIIVINDGSTDQTEAQLNAFKHARGVKIISRENRGLIATLNEGVQLANGTYLARMDADDIALPGRIETQIAYMQKSAVDFAGSSIQTFGAFVKRVKHYPEDDRAIKFSLLFFSCFAHPSVIGKTSVFQENPYHPGFDKIEDYELWTRMAKKGISMGNVPEVLLRYRVHKKQVSSVNRNFQDSMRVQISTAYASTFFEENLVGEIFPMLISREFGVLSACQIAKLNAFYQFLSERYPEFQPIVDYQFFLCLLHHNFGRDAGISFLEKAGWVKRNFLKTFNASKALKPLPAKIYRALY